VETLPIWFWIVYSTFILLTLGTAIFSNFKEDRIPLAYITIILSFALPLVSFLFSIGRGDNDNEFSYMMKEVADGSLTAIMLILGYIYLTTWLVLFIKDNFGQYISKLSGWITTKIKNSPYLHRKQDGA
jgi:hypothetical protein